ncbi:hypothetical protein Btru_023472 [Bulinus truncatus]|nr:hypothetical protein Btru_023472 [Bulinus truncatus]
MEERGVGELKILKSKDKNKFRIIMRRDQQTCSSPRYWHRTKLGAVLAMDFSEGGNVNWRSWQLDLKMLRRTSTSRQSFLGITILLTLAKSSKESNKPLSELFPKPKSGSWGNAKAAILEASDDVQKCLNIALPVGTGAQPSHYTCIDQAPLNELFKLLKLAAGGVTRLSGQKWFYVVRSTLTCGR